MKIKKYYQFNIASLPFNPDIISGMMWQLDIQGINEFDNYISVFAAEESEVCKESIDKILIELMKQNLIESYTVDEFTLEDKNWNEEWEKKIQVIEVTDKIVIKPSFRKYQSKPGQIIITIDPKMSFGTGEHETTKLVLSLLEKYIEKGMRVLDIGSGTGILSIASSLLGAEKVIGIDNDEWCLKNGKENILLNNVQDSVEIRLCEIDQVENEKFDLIVANINKHILLDIGKYIVGNLTNHGKVILSGLLIADKDDIQNLYKEYNLQTIEEQTMGEWLSLVFAKKS